MQDNVLPDVIGPASEPAQAGFKRLKSHIANPRAISEVRAAAFLDPPKLGEQRCSREASAVGAIPSRAGASSCSRPSIGEATRCGPSEHPEREGFADCLGRLRRGTRCCSGCCQSCAVLARSQASSAQSKTSLGASPNGSAEQLCFPFFVYFREH